MKRQSQTLKKIDNIQGWLSIIPVVIIILVVKAYPMIVGILESFTNWDGLFRNDFIGLDNYISILSGKQFWSLLSNNLILLLYIPIQLILGLIVAVLLYEETFGWKFFRSCYYLPQVLSSLSIGYLFVVFFALDGPINAVFKFIKLDNLAINWLGHRFSALFVILVCLVWINIGWQGMLFLGGMASISPSIYEAAKLDGAGYFARMFKITLPMLIRTVEYSCVMSVLWCFTGLFNLIFSITKGGPGYETTTVDYMIYLKAFEGGSEFGYASAIAVLLMVIVLIFTMIQMKFTNKADDWS